MQEFVLKFHPGQIIDHKKFGYRGVIYDADAQFCGSDAWYEEVAKSRPPKEAPWYHVLVDGSDQTTYVAERHLENSANTSKIQHPLVETFFSDFKDGAYVLAMKQ